MTFDKTVLLNFIFIAIISKSVQFKCLQCLLSSCSLPVLNIICQKYSSSQISCNVWHLSFTVLLLLHYPV